MKHKEKLSFKTKRLLKKNGLNPKHFVIAKEDMEIIVLFDMFSDTTVFIYKGETKWIISIQNTTELET